MYRLKVDIRKYYEADCRKALLQFQEELRKLTEQFSDVMRFKEECDRLLRELKRRLREARCIEPKKEREPLPTYMERLHPRSDYQRKPYWLRTRSNPQRRRGHG